VATRSGQNVLEAEKNYAVSIPKSIIDIEPWLLLT